MSDFGRFMIDRGLFEHPAFDAEPFTEREAWMWMVGSAARGEKARRVNNAAVILERGQLAFSIRFMGNRWKWRPARVQRFLSRLVTECMIEVATSTDMTKITICNYDKYQVTEFNRVTESPVAESPTSNEQPSVTDCRDTIIEHANAPPESPPESASIQIKKENNLPDSESGGGVGGNACAREPLISEAAHQLAIDVMKTLGLDVEFVPPGWCGAPMWFEAGLRSGWQPEIVRIAAAKIRARRNYQPPYSFRYLGKPIIREHELMAEPSLPVAPVVISNQENPHAKTAAPQDWRASRDAFRVAHAKLKDFNESAGTASSPTGGEVVQLAPAAGRHRS